MNRHLNGFSLIELMLTVAILAIIVAVALPSYQRYINRANRIEGMALLSNAAAAQERYFSLNRRYLTAQDDVGKLGLRNTAGSQVTSSNALYRLQLSAGIADNGGYLLTAVPQGSQQNDVLCANLSLDATGSTGASGTEGVKGCWK